jgi:pimeloyl-ACP methyl ester carboxylesterase
MVGYVLILFLLQFTTPSSARNHTLNCAGVGSVNPRCASNETTHRRDFFYVGGRSLETTTGNVTVDQIYVEKLSPLGGSKKKAPLVFFHGGSTSGVSWLNTPDNRYACIYLNNIFCGH